MFLARITSRRGIAFAAVWLSVLAAPGCAANDALSAQDQRVVDQLAEIAPLDSRIEGEVSGVECWKPSENMVDDSTFRVICRLHYVQESTDDSNEQGAVERYRDMICVGDPGADPVSEYCYIWAYYSDMPKYEDKTGYVVR